MSFKSNIPKSLQEGRCGYVILVMAIFWMAEVVPIAVTAFIPVFAFPLLGVLSTKELTPAYMEGEGIERDQVVT